MLFLKKKQNDMESKLEKENKRMQQEVDSIYR